MRDGFIVGAFIGAVVFLIGWVAFTAATAPPRTWHTFTTPNGAVVECYGRWDYPHAYDFEDECLIGDEVRR